MTCSASLGTSMYVRLLLQATYTYDTSSLPGALRGDIYRNVRVAVWWEASTST